MPDSNAVLGWGFEIPRWGPDTPDWLSDKDYDGPEWEERYATAKGLTRVEWGEHGYDEYAREKDALVELSGCVLFDYDEETGPVFVAVAASVVKADWEGLKSVDMEGLVGLNPQQCENWLRSFCELLHIPWKEPHWFLTAYAL